MTHPNMPPMPEPGSYDELTEQAAKLRTELARIEDRIRFIEHTQWLEHQQARRRALKEQTK